MSFATHQIMSKILSALETEDYTQIDKCLEAYSDEQKKQHLTIIAKQLYTNSDNNLPKIHLLVNKYDLDMTEILPGYLSRFESTDTVASLITDGSDSVQAFRRQRPTYHSISTPVQTASAYARSKYIIGVNEVLARHTSPEVINAALSGYIASGALESEADAALIFVMTDNAILRAEIARFSKFTPDKVVLLSTKQQARSKYQVNYSQATAMANIMKEYVLGDHNLKLNMRQAYALTKPGVREWLLQGMQIVRGQIDQITPRSAGRISKRELEPTSARASSRESTIRSLRTSMSRRDALRTSGETNPNAAAALSAARTSTPPLQILDNETITVTAPPSPSRRSSASSLVRQLSGNLFSKRVTPRAALTTSRDTSTASAGAKQALKTSSTNMPTNPTLTDAVSAETKRVPGEIYMLITAYFLGVSEQDAHDIFAAVNLRFYKLMLDSINKSNANNKEELIDDATQRYQARLGFYKALNVKSAHTEATLQAARAAAGDSDTEFKFKPLQFNPKK